jgi:subtilisin family serine protease
VQTSLWSRGFASGCSYVFSRDKYFRAFCLILFVFGIVTDTIVFRSDVGEPSLPIVQADSSQSDVTGSVAFPSSGGEPNVLPIVQADSPQRDVSAAALLSAARTEGSLRVRIGLRLPDASRSKSHTWATRAPEIDQALDIVAMKSVSLRSKRTIRKFGSAPFMSMTVSPEELERLMKDPNVQWIRRTSSFSLNLEYSRGLVRADALAAATNIDGTGSVVAVLDSGVDDSHPMLIGKIIQAAAACFSGLANNPQHKTVCPSKNTVEIGMGAGRPCKQIGCWHGTHVASIAAGSGPLNGIARGASIIPVKVVSNNAGGLAIDDDDLTAALMYVYGLRNTYKIAAVNLSIGFGGYSSACDNIYPDYAAAFDLLRSAGIAPVVAAGNSGSDRQLSSPACLSNAISVAASTKADTVASFSNFSEQAQLLAPGEEIHAALPGGAYGFASGTSMAAPHVAGAFAILREQYPQASIDQLLDALACSGKTLERARNGVARPRIDLIGAVAALSPTVSSRKWLFDDSEDGYDWASLRGEWNVQDDVNSGQPTDSSVVASMFSTCGKSAFIRVGIKLASVTKSDSARAGVIVNPAIDYVSNTISGYWISFSSLGHGANVMLLNGKKLDGEADNSATEICNDSLAIVYPDKFNSVEVLVAPASLQFRLNGRPLCQVSTPPNSSAARIAVAAQFDNPSPDDRLLISRARISTPGADGAFGPHAHSLLGTVQPKSSAQISVVRRPESKRAPAGSTGSAETMYPL